MAASSPYGAVRVGAPNRQSGHGLAAATVDKFCFLGSYGLLCYDWQGELLWEKRLGPFLKMSSATSSPILVDDLVVLNQDHDVDSFLMAIDQQSGRRDGRPTAEATRSCDTGDTRPRRHQSRF